MHRIGTPCALPFLAMLEILVNGLARGAIYALIALGYTMVYGILGMINFAHGEIFMIGMFGAVYGLGALGSMGLVSVGLTLPLAILIAMVLSAGFGMANERLAYRRLRNAHLLAPLTSAIGMSIVLQNFVMLSVTKGKIDFPRAVAAPLADTKWAIGPLHLTALQALIFSVTLVLMGGLFWLIQRTRLGIALRAVAQDRTMASLCGMKVDGLITFTFALGSALAASAGAMVAMYQGVVRFDSGYMMGLKAFAAAVLGGIGNIPGAVIGGLVIGLTEDVTSYTIASEWKQSTAFAILILVLWLRPRGLLGERVADKV
jgi:branched-chain amino acid transport system permease protein